MRYLFLTIILLTFSEAFAQTGKQAMISHKQVVASQLEASVDGKGKLIFQGKDTATGKPVMLSAEEGFEALKAMAKAACAAAPSSVTVSAGVVSVTWEKSELCK